ncbi:MAG: hypothetical protein K9M99_02815 [Candidatus Cloacimonetes bacterium]|nr:hypothetical protein [Candidatus Cloacimonadota bacterium]
MNEFEALAREIVSKYRQRLDKIGLVLRGQLIKMASDRKIRAKGDFINNMSYELVETGEGFVLRLGSNVDHAEYVLGGKEPSGTPFEPLEQWIKDKGIVWYRGNKEMSTKQMIFLIVRKHKEKGIEARNIVQELIDKREDWILSQLREVK